jgi:hypothetical protein
MNKEVAVKGRQPEIKNCYNLQPVVECPVTDDRRPGYETDKVL